MVVLPAQDTQVTSARRTPESTTRAEIRPLMSLTTVSCSFWRPSAVPA